MKLTLFLALFFVLSLTSVQLIFAHDRNYGMFLQITDTHLDLEYDVGSPATCWLGSTGLGCCRSYDIPIAPYSKAGPYGDHNCDSPLLLINGAFEWLSRQQSQIDFVIWTGDSVDHHDFSDSPRKNLHNMKVSSQLFFDHLDGVQVYPSLGNHDTFPIDQLGPKPFNDFVMNEISDLWEPWLNNSDPSTMKTLRYAGYYTILMKKGFRLISLNSLYYDNHNVIFGKQNERTMNQWAWLNDTLSDARMNGEKVWIIGHIFPGAGEAATWFDTGFQDMFNKYKDIIIHNFWGHSHRDQFVLYRDQNDNVTGMGFICPSVQPDHQESSLRFYVYDRDTFEVMDYHDYTFDVVNATSHSPQQIINYNYYYSAKELYNLPDLSYKSWANLAEQFKTNSTLIDFYWDHYYPGHKNFDNPCDQRCQTILICEIMFINQTQYHACLSS
jgi:hypothetical protein